MQARETTTYLAPCSSNRPNLRLIPQPMDDDENWKTLLNFLYLHERDELFRWAKTVRESVEKAG